MQRRIQRTNKRLTEKKEKKEKTEMKKKRSTKPKEPTRTTIIRTRPDGNCLFSAIGLYIGQSADNVRQTIARHLVADQTLAALVRDFYAMEPIDYGQWICQKGNWGGELEIRAATQLWKIVIVVFTEDQSPLTYGLEHLSADSNTFRPPLRLLYRRSHYDVLSMN